MQAERATPRLLVTGCNGQVGFELQRSLAPLGEVLALDRTACDLTRPDTLRQLVRELRPDVIVNAAAFTAVDAAEKEIGLANAINVIAPGILAEEASSRGALMVHYSTDYVFDGAKPDAYVETDIPNPLSEYGKSKLSGERLVSAATDNHLIFRTSWIYGLHGGNFLKSIIHAAKVQTTLNVVDDQWGAPTSASLVADITAFVINRYLNRAQQHFAPGTYHLSSLGKTNWCEYARLIVRYLVNNGVQLALRPQDILAVTAKEYGSLATRPTNSQLDTTKLRDEFGITIPKWEVDVKHTLRNLIDVAEFSLLKDTNKISEDIK